MVRVAVIDMTTGQVVDGEDVLGDIEAAIPACGLPHEIVRGQDATSSALPLAAGPTGITKVLSFTDRVVALRRTDVTVTSSASARYAAAASLGPVRLERGWVRVSIERDGKPVHLLTTHLEVQGLPAVHASQLLELLGSGLAGSTA